MKRVLVIRGGAIGDFILTLPAVKLLRDNFPNAHIEILGYKHIIALAENRFYANATRSIVYAPLSRFFARDAELPADGGRVGHADLGRPDGPGVHDLLDIVLGDQDWGQQHRLDRAVGRRVR